MMDIESSLTVVLRSYLQLNMTVLINETLVDFDVSLSKQLLYE